MSTHLGKHDSDINCWGAVHNDYHRTLLGTGEWISVEANANNPPTVKQYTRFQKYATDATYTIPATPSTDNNCYPNNTAPTYLLSQAIYEDGADVTFTWSGATRGETLPAQSDGTWYLVCKNQYDSSASTKGQGVYTVSKTETPTWSYEKGGYYSTSGYRVLAAFTSASGTVALTHVYNGECVHRESDGDLVIKNTTSDGDIYINVNDGGTNSNAVFIDGATRNIIFSSNGKLSSGGEAAPDVDAGGLCLNHGAGSGNVLTLKNSSIDHGITGVAETDTYGYIKKWNAAEGGAYFVGLTEGLSGMNLAGIVTTNDTTIGTTANAAVRLIAAKKNGTTIGGFAAGDNLLVVTDVASVRFIIQQDGDIYTDSAGGAGGSGDATVRYYDNENDIMLADAARKALGHQKIDTSLQPYRDRLEELGIMKNGFVSHHKMMGLNLGTLNQLFNIIKKLADKLNISEDELFEMARS